MTRVTHFYKRFGNTLVHAGYLTNNGEDRFYHADTLCRGLRAMAYVGKPSRASYIGEERLGWEFFAFDPDDERACRRCAAAYRREVAA